MKITIEGSHKNIAVIQHEGLLISDVDSALELAMSVRYETGADHIVIEKKCVAEDFFILSTKLAGEILQKYTTYQIRFAIVGDYSRYTSKPLHDFIYESNQGKNFFFVGTVEEAIVKMDE